MLCGYSVLKWVATVCPAGFPAGTFNSFSKHACIVTFKSKHTVQAMLKVDHVFTAHPGQHPKEFISLVIH